MLATRNLVSIGKLARSLSVTVDELAELAGALKISPLQTIDGVPFFSTADEARFALALITRPANRQMNNRLVVRLQGGPHNGRKWERERPSIGTTVEVILNLKSGPKKWGQSHRYVAIYRGGQTITLKHCGTLSKLADPFHQAEIGEG